MNRDMLVELKPHLYNCINIKAGLEKALGGKYQVDVTYSKWQLADIGFAEQCVLVRKNDTVGACVSINTNAGRLDVNGVPPNPVFSSLGVIGKWFLGSAQSRLAEEVSSALSTI